MEFRRIAKVRFNTTHIIIKGFLILILLGTVLLMLPCASASGKATDFITALFTATTSSCVTGLVVVPTYAYWSLFGKIVILILIQLGGLGVICFTIGIFIIIGKRISLKERKLIQESYNLDSGKGILNTVRKIFFVTFLTEGLGAVVYSTQFIPKYGLVKGIGYSIFHSISAFCNAGIDLIGDDSLISYQNNVVVNINTMLLIVVGGLGFVAWMDIFKQLKEIKNGEIAGRKFIERMSTHSRIVLVMTFILIFGGFILVYLFENNNPQTLGTMSGTKKVMAALFESVTFRTAGFSTISQSSITDATFIIACILMLIGGSPMGTAGGIKTTTVALVYLSVRATVKGKDDVIGFRRRLNSDNIRSALAITTVALVVLTVAVIALTLTEDATLKHIVFEAVSAIGTVGISMDLTAKLSSAGRIIIIILMFFGRVGPITIAMAFAEKSKKNSSTAKLAEKRVLVG